MTTQQPTPHRQHITAIRTWSEYVKTEKSRGATLREIQTALLRNGLSPEAAEAVLQVHDTSFLREEAISKYWYKPVLGTLLLAFGIFGIVFSLANLLFCIPSVSIFAYGLWQFGSYRQKLHGN